MKVFFGGLLFLVGLGLVVIGLWKVAVIPLILGHCLFASDEKDMIENWLNRSG